MGHDRNPLVMLASDSQGAVADAAMAIAAAAGALAGRAAGAEAVAHSEAAIMIDEFTTVLDRTAAATLSAGIRDFMVKCGVASRPLVVATVHSDIACAHAVSHRFTALCPSNHDLTVNPFHCQVAASGRHRRRHWPPSGA